MVTVETYAMSSVVCAFIIVSLWVIIYTEITNMRKDP